MTGGWSPENGGRAGTGFRDGLWHALGEPYPGLASAADPKLDGVPGDGPAGTATRWTLCGLVADVMRKAGLFDPDRATTGPSCGWWEAIRTATIPDRLAQLAGAPRRGLAVALAEAIVAAAGGPGGDGIDHPGTVELLAAVTAHAGDVLLNGACVEGECDHDDVPEGCPPLVVACPACSVITGQWAGEWADHYRVEATVPAPCSLLLAMATHYRIGADLFGNAQLVGSLRTSIGGAAVAGGGT